MTTARFWHFHRDGWVKLTLRDDQELHYGYGGPTEEGWSRHDENLRIEEGAGHLHDGVRRPRLRRAPDAHQHRALPARQAGVARMHAVRRSGARSDMD